MTNLYFSLAIYTALAIALGFGLWLYFSVQKQIASLRKEIAARGEYSTTDRQRILERYRAGAAPFRHSRAEIPQSRTFPSA